MKIYLSFVLLFILSLHTFSQKTKVIDCDQFYHLITINEDVVLLDIRIVEKYKKMRIINSFWAGNKDTLKPIIIDLNKQMPIFLYCEIGKRSKQCSKWLNSLGYKNIYELKGGFKDWLKNGYPVDSSKVVTQNSLLNE